MGAPGISALSPQVRAAIAERELQYATPSAYPAINRSAYLADALRQMSTEGGKNIRTPMALGANLLAEALLSRSSKKADQQAASQQQASLAQVLDAQAQGALGPGSSPQTAAGAATGGAPGPAAPPAAPPMPQAPPMAPGGPAPASGGIMGQPVTQQAVQTVESGNNPNAVSPAGARGLMQVMPTTGANPGFGVQPMQNQSPEENQRFGSDYMAALTRKYGGNQVLGAIAYNWGPGNTDRWLSQGADPRHLPAETRAYVGQLALQGARPSPGAQSTASGAQAPPAPRPLQVSTGPDPSIPSPGAAAFAPQNPAPQPPGAGTGPSAPTAGGPGSQFAPQPAPIQPYQQQELMRLRALAGQNPAFIPQFQAYASALEKQRTSPEELDISRPNEAGQVQIIGKQSGRSYGVVSAPGTIVNAAPKEILNADGSYTALPGTGFKRVDSGSPAVIAQLNQGTGETKYERNPAYGETPPGMRVDAAGGAQQVPGALPLQQKLDLIKGFVGAKEYQDYTESNVALNSLKALAAQRTGPATFAAYDQYLRASNPGVSARPSALEIAEQMFGKQSKIYQEVNSWVNTKGAILPPQIMQAMISGAQSMTEARYKALAPQINAYTYAAHKAGIDPSEIMPAVSLPGTGAALASGAPAPGATGEQPPAPGARKAPDGKWYVQKGGQYFEVRP